MGFDPVRDAILNSPERTGYGEYPFGQDAANGHGGSDNGGHGALAGYHEKQSLKQSPPPDSIQVANDGSTTATTSFKTPLSLDTNPVTMSNSSPDRNQRILPAVAETPLATAMPQTPGVPLLNTPLDISLPSANGSSSSSSHHHAPVRRQSSIFSLLSPEPPHQDQVAETPYSRTEHDTPFSAAADGQASTSARNHTVTTDFFDNLQKPPSSKPVPSSKLAPTSQLALPPSQNPSTASSRHSSVGPSTLSVPPSANVRHISPGENVPLAPSHVPKPAVKSTPAPEPIKRGRPYAPHARATGPPARSMYEPLTEREMKWYNDPANCRNPLRTGFAGAVGNGAPDQRGKVSGLRSPMRNPDARNGVRDAPPADYAPQPPQLQSAQALIDPNTIDVNPQYADPEPLHPSLVQKPVRIARLEASAVAGQANSQDREESPSTSSPRKRKRAPSSSDPTPSKNPASPSKPAKKALVQVSEDGAKVAAHYNNRQNVSREERTASPIIGLKSFNNWVKSVLIAKYARYVPDDAQEMHDVSNGNGVSHGGGTNVGGRRRGPPIRVLDLGCGKGGDLQKWQKAGLKYYLGVDIAQISVQQARSRWQEIRGARFPADFFALDAFSNPLSAVVPQKVLDEPFDVVSMQFCMHYAFQSVSKARMMLENVSRHLRKGGTFVGTIPDSEQLLERLRELPPEANPLQFGNSVYHITFEDRSKFPAFGHQYSFFLQDAVEDVPEYVVQWDSFETLAAEYSLKVVYRATFHDLFSAEQDDPDFSTLLVRMRVVNQNGESELDEEQWEAANIYVAFAFVKV